MADAGDDQPGATPRIGVVVHARKQLGGGLEELRSALADAGHADPPWYEVDKSKKAPKAVKRLVEDDGVDRVLVWGGDGTVRRTIHTIVERELDAAVAILPAGTGNLLAKNLGVPIDIAGAVDIALHGEARPLDLGVMNGHYFAVMGGAGFDALMIRDADAAELKDRYGRVGYVIAGAKHRNVAPAQVTVVVDGHEWYRGEASCVIAGNVGTILGGVQAFPDASPTDGRLDIGVVLARSATEWLRVMTGAALKRAHKSPLTEMTTGRCVEVRFDRTLPWEVDGGDRDRTDSFDIRCVPSAVRICQPQRTDAGTTQPTDATTSERDS
jgi:diacylglycerol kinase (ATP)